MHYFAHVLLEVYRFDRGTRTPEVHGSSRIFKQFLRFESPTRAELNEPNALTNALLNVWRPLIEILNGEKATGMALPIGETNWFEIYMDGSPEEVESRSTAMFDELD